MDFMNNGLIRLICYWNNYISGELLQAKATLNSILDNSVNVELKIKAEDLLESVSELKKQYFPQEIRSIQENDSTDG